MPSVGRVEGERERMAKKKQSKLKKEGTSLVLPPHPFYYYDSCTTRASARHYHSIPWN